MIIFNVIFSFLLETTMPESMTGAVTINLSQPVPCADKSAVSETYDEMLNDICPYEKCTTTTFLSGCIESGRRKRSTGNSELVVSLKMLLENTGIVDVSSDVLNASGI